MKIEEKRSMVGMRIDNMMENMVEFRKDEKKIMEMVEKLMRKKIGMREIERREKEIGKIIVEDEVDIKIKVEGKVERKGRRRRIEEGRKEMIGKKKNSRRSIGMEERMENKDKEILCIGKKGEGEMSSIVIGESEELRKSEESELSMKGRDNDEVEKEDGNRIDEKREKKEENEEENENEGN